jgi:hypothetical protein
MSVKTDRLKFEVSGLACPRDASPEDPDNPEKCRGAMGIAKRAGGRARSRWICPFGVDYVDAERMPFVLVRKAV